MIIGLWFGILLWILMTVAVYRLGMADGLSAARRGRLAGGKAERQEDLLAKIDAYDGRKETYEQFK